MSNDFEAFGHRLGRRSFLKWSAGVSGALVASGVLRNGLIPADEAIAAAVTGAGKETIVPTGCARSHCGNNCVIKAVVKDYGTPAATIVRIEPDDQPEVPGKWQLRACARGHAIRKQVYSSDRVKYPMKRKNWAPGGGAANVHPELRGTDEWVRISWDEAATLIAAEMKRLKEKHGNEAFHDLGQSGSVKLLHGRPWVQRLLNKFGGYTAAVGSYSFPGTGTAHKYLWGIPASQHDFWDMLNSDHCLFWSFNPVAMGQQSLSEWYLTLIKEKFEKEGKRMVLVDPWFNRTGQVFADEWVPIKFQTDEAMMLAMLHVLFTDPKYSAKIDQPWLDARSVGILPRAGKGTPQDPTVPADDSLKYYVLGWDENGKPAPEGHKNYPAKTPAWASVDTGIAAETIIKVTKDYADNSVFMGTGKKAAFYTGWGMNRRAYGENPYILAAAIATITKNIGVSGGGPGFTQGGFALDSGDTGASPGKNPLAGTHNFDVANRTLAIAGKPVRNETTFAWRTYNIKMLWGAAGNILNQGNDLNLMLQGLRDNVELFVISDPIWSVSAQHADIVLPICTTQELNDICPGYQLSPQMVFMNKCIEPLFEAKADMEACKLVADKLGIGKDFIPNTEDNMLKAVWEDTDEWNGGMTYEQFKAAGVAKFDRWKNPTVFLKDFIADPAKAKVKPKVPSGKIEFYSMTIKGLIDSGKISGKDTRPIPTYPPRIEGPGDPILAKYPLLDGQPASFRQSHTTFGNLAWVKEMGQDEDGVIMHPDDAGARGIKNGDKVRVWNDRGEMWLKAIVTNTIAKGCTITARGSWYKPVKPGVIGSPAEGGASVLTLVGRTSSLNVGSPSGSCAVQVAKI